MPSPYEIKITDYALKELNSLDKKTYLKIKQAMQKLSENPRPKGCKKLINRDAWRIRVGDFRVIYEIHDYKLLIIIIRVANRKIVYR